MDFRRCRSLFLQYIVLCFITSISITAAVLIRMIDGPRASWIKIIIQDVERAEPVITVQTFSHLKYYRNHLWTYKTTIINRLRAFI